MTVDGCISFLKKEEGIDLSPTQMRKKLNNIPELKTVVGEKIEAERATINFQDLRNYYSNLEKVISGRDSRLIFNLDEIGFDSYVDAVSKRFVVTAEKGPTPFTPVKRVSNRITFLKCIALEGPSPKPLVIIKKKTISPEHAIELRHNAILRFHDSAFMTKEFFGEWMEKIFLPHVLSIKKEVKQKKKAVLIMDGFRGHELTNDLKEKVEKIIDIIYLVPHSSHLAQPLDLCYFGFWKSFLGRSGGAIVNWVKDEEDYSDDPFDFIKDQNPDRWVNYFQTSSEIGRIKSILLIDSLLELKGFNVSSFKRAGIMRKIEVGKVTKEDEYPIDALSSVAVVDINSAEKVIEYLGEEKKEKKTPEKLTSIHIENPKQRNKRMGK